MDLHQLKTFVTVAREGSITRSSQRLHLSQPAVSAHIKAMEEGLGLALFERTPRGMALTQDGQRLLAKAEQTLAAHQDLMAEATRSKGELSGKFRIGAGSNSGNESIGRLLTSLAARFPRVEVILKHQTSQEVLAGIRNGNLEAGFYNEPEEPAPDLCTIEVSDFAIFVVAAPGGIAAPEPLDWQRLSKLPWIYPTESACCNRTAEKLFTSHAFKPKRIISADRQEITRTLVASGVGVGLLHADTAKEAQRLGEVELLFQAQARVRILFASLASRANDPLLMAASSIMASKATG